MDRGPPTPTGGMMLTSTRSGFFKSLRERPLLRPDTPQQPAEMLLFSFFSTTSYVVCSTTSTTSQTHTHRLPEGTPDLDKNKMSAVPGWIPTIESPATMGPQLSNHLPVQP